jgi:hypothetical protein
VITLAAVRGAHTCPIVMDGPIPPTPGQRLTSLLAESHVLKLATTGGPLSPWIAAAFFVEDGPFSLLLMLEGGGKTMTNLRADPRLAVMLECGDALAPFAQGAGKVRLDGLDTKETIARIAAKTPESAPLLAIPGQLPVRIEIDRWWMTDVKAGLLPGKLVERPSEGG